MKRTTVVLLTLLSFSLLSLNLSTTLAIQQGYRARFSCYATGECVILLGGTLGPSPPKETFIGRGAMSLSGSADVDEYPPNEHIPYTFYVAYDGVNAKGKVLAKWNTYMISVFLYSCDEANGFFVDEDEMSDVFTAGWLPGSTEVPLMLFKGTYKDLTGIHVISGKVGVLAFPVGDSAIMLIGAMFYKSDNTPLLTILWVPTDQNLGPLGSVHAACSFVHSVKIIKLL